MLANQSRDAGYTNATASFLSEQVVDNKGGSIYEYFIPKHSESEIGSVDLGVFANNAKAHRSHYVTEYFWQKHLKRQSLSRSQ